MTRDDIIRMAEEAEINLLFKGHPEHPERDSNDVIIFTGWVNHRTLRRFATLVAAAEREACATFLERVVDLSHLNKHRVWQKYTADLLAGCAAAIRARGEG